MKRKINNMKRMHAFLRLSAVTIACSALILTGCKDSVNADEVDSREMPKSNVSFKNDIQPVLELKCNYSGCHDDASRAGGLSLASWSGVTSSYDIVFPGQPANSQLVLVLKSGTVTPMPPEGYVPLTTKQVDGITTWIKEGAKNN